MSKTGATHTAVLPAGGTAGVEALTGHRPELKQTLSLWALLALSYSNMVRPLPLSPPPRADLPLPAL